jgi:hypothetical protein
MFDPRTLRDIPRLPGFLWRAVKLGSAQTDTLEVRPMKRVFSLVVAGILLAGMAGAQSDSTGVWGSREPVAQDARPDEIAAGTRFLVRLEDTLDTKKLESGKRFKMKLTEDLTTSSGLVIPRGKKIKAHISAVDKGARGRMLISLDEIETRKGWVPLIGTVVDVPGERGVQIRDNEGEITRAGGRKGRMIKGAAIGAGAGAITGAIAGGTKGAVIGAAAGAGIGVGAGMLFNQDLRLEKGTTMELRLDRNLRVPSR